MMFIYKIYLYIYMYLCIGKFVRLINQLVLVPTSGRLIRDSWYWQLVIWIACSPRMVKSKNLVAQAVNTAYFKVHNG